jgi:Flp pilus assembly protein TadG
VRLPIRQAALWRDLRGVSALEFAFVAPVMCLLLVGAFDIAHGLYVTATVQGIVQKTSRDSSLESGSTTAAATAIDNRVRAQVLALANNGTVAFKRRYYRTFTLAQTAIAETWNEGNGNGRCDNGEGYQDANGNGVWDADGGDAGQGGAKDKTVYTVTVSHQHLLPVWKYIGGSNMQTITASTVLQNQPYGDQASYSATIVTRYCA